MGEFSVIENAKDYIEVMTYNIHAGIGTDNVLDIERISQVIRESGAEIVALNEVDCLTARSKGINEVESIAKNLGFNYYFGKTIDYRGGEYGNALVSIYPIVTSESFILPGDGLMERETRGLIKCILDVRGEKVNVLVTHLGLDASERKAQIEYISHMIDRLQGKIILMGDFNITQDHASEELELLMKAMKDSASDIDETEKLNTFDSLKPRKKIDYIMVSENLQVLSNKTINSNASDHLPLLSVLKLK
jgi:endonuclease/exonuclease/phosphatase family metal-dependent hydrolase